MIPRQLLRPSRALRPASAAARFSTSSRLREQPSYQAPTPPPAADAASNPHRDFYKTFGRPIAKVYVPAASSLPFPPDPIRFGPSASNPVTTADVPSPVHSFLGALFTYQVLYYGWARLEAMDEKEDKQAELATLEAELRALDAKRQLAATEIGSAAHKVEAAAERGADKAWSSLSSWFGGGGGAK
ncbi:hypothetical protein MBLNU459_g0334t1 [Dothideomycetes sp. NU459]